MSNPSNNKKHYPYTYLGFIMYFLRLGATGFGGPLALLGYMQRDLVEERGWISRRDYIQGLAFSKLCPGPLGTQLAIYLGWVKAKTLGATQVMLAFIFAPFCIILGIAILYVEFKGLPWVHGFFYGVGPAVVGIILINGYYLAKMVLNKRLLLWGIFVFNVIVTVLFSQELVSVFIISGCIAAFYQYRQDRNANLYTLMLSSGLVLHVQDPFYMSMLLKFALAFLIAGTFVFGSGLAILPFLHHSLVSEHHWLTDQQFTDAIAVGMIAPGPIIMSVVFMGYLISGVLGAGIAALCIVLPCYLLVILIAPFYRRVADHPLVMAGVEGLTSAATGAIIGSAFLIGKQTIPDITAFVIFAIAFLLFLFLKKLPPVFVVLAAGVVGLILKG